MRLNPDLSWRGTYPSSFGSWLDILYSDSVQRSKEKWERERKKKRVLERREQLLSYGLCPLTIVVHQGGVCLLFVLSLWYHTSTTIHLPLQWRAKINGAQRRQEQFEKLWPSKKNIRVRGSDEDLSSFVRSFGGKGLRDCLHRHNGVRLAAPLFCLSLRVLSRWKRNDHAHKTAPVKRHAGHVYADLLAFYNNGARHYTSSSSFNSSLFSLLCFFFYSE